MLHKVEWNEQTVSHFWDNIDILIENGNKQNDYFSSVYAKQVLKKINKLVDFKHKKILDYGCGQGDLIKVLCNDYQIEEAYGCDLSQKSVDIVNDSNKSCDKFRGAVKIESDAVPYGDEKFDIILLTELIEHLDDKSLKFAISEITRMLKKNGIIVITTPNKEELKNNIVVCPECECYFHKVQHVRSWSVQSLSNYLIHFGIRMIKYKKTTLRLENSILKKIYARAYDLMYKVTKREPRNLIFVGKKCD